MLLAVSLSVCRAPSLELRCAKTAERIEVLFGVKPLGSTGNFVLDGGPDLPQRVGEESASDATFAKLL